MKIKYDFPSTKCARFLLSVLLLALALSVQPITAKASEKGSLDNFRATRTYEKGLFDDVADDDWYASGIAEAYELGLISGKTERHFDPQGELTTVEAVAMAARLHSIYYTGNDDFPIGRMWYESCVRYALDNGLLVSRYDILSPATRARFADILARALPEKALQEIGTVDDDAIPDVKSGDTYAGAIYLLYRAGILSGSDDLGTFYPDSTITRAEAAAIVTRMTDPSRRQSLTLIAVGPDVPEQPEADDVFFAESAILGNSLVDGLQLYSGLKTIEYFSSTGMSVDSIMGQDAPLLQSMCSVKHDRVYIELGINEIVYTTDQFISRYSKLLDKIIAAQPEAEIYIISVLPVTMAKSTSSIYNMTRVNAYNEALYQLAAEKDCRYLDVTSVMIGDDGYLPASWSWDGVHLHASRYSVWENYMRTHY